MRILLFSWKDIRHPAAGGAELVTLEIARRLVGFGHVVTIFTSRPAAFPAGETIDGVQIVRAGGRYSVYLWAVYHYLRFFRGKFDLVVDQVNTVPFFTPLFVGEKKVAFFHQLAREIWFYETRFPISLIGFLAEPLCLRLYRNVPAITVSPSSRKDLERAGIKKIYLISEAIAHHPLTEFSGKKETSSLVFVGRLVPSKRVVDVIEVFSKLAEKFDNLQLYIVGSGTKIYEEKLKKLADELGLGSRIIFTGYVSDEERTKLLSESSVLLVTSIKEGWGLVVTEAAAGGTPAVVYDVDGLRDAVTDGVTGLICRERTPAAMARLVSDLLSDGDWLNRLSLNAWQASRNFTFERTAAQFLNALEAERGRRA